MSSAMAKTRAALVGVGSNFWLRDLRAPAAVLETAGPLPLDRDGIARFDLRVEQGRIAAIAPDRGVCAWACGAGRVDVLGGR